MYEPIEIPPFEAQFEDVRIYINSLQIVEINEVLLDAFPPASPYTNIWHDLSVNGLPMQKDLVGKLYIFFRNQGSDQELALSLDMIIRARAKGDTKAADTFCKTVQYLFDWTANWVEENNIQDKYGKKFIMPAFLYSSHHFEQAFPQ